MPTDPQSLDPEADDYCGKTGKGRPDGQLTRREFVTRVTVFGAGCFIPSELLAGRDGVPSAEIIHARELELNCEINEIPRAISVDTRVTLLDTLREKLSLFGTKKGCDHGQCGACTVLMNGRRVNSCLILAGMCQHAKITTIEGLAHGDKLHPMQEAFIHQDAFQCGYCTPGQICSAVGLLREGHARSDAEIREQMSGNICRCGAYQNILAAVKEVQSTEKNSGSI
jgi:xanthine dehydrogenase YagT iron-sulfur-binding subunit